MPGFEETHQRVEYSDNLRRKENRLLGGNLLRLRVKELGCSFRMVGGCGFDVFESEGEDR